jgi:hypothetical protein
LGNKYLNSLSICGTDPDPGWKKIQICEPEWKNPDPGLTCGVPKTYAYNQDPDPHLAGLENIRIQNNNNNRSHPEKREEFTMQAEKDLKYQLSEN